MTAYETRSLDESHVSSISAGAIRAPRRPQVPEIDSAETRISDGKSSASRLKEMASGKSASLGGPDLHGTDGL